MGHPKFKKQSKDSRLQCDNSKGHEKILLFIQFYFATAYVVGTPFIVVRLNEAYLETIKATFGIFSVFFCAVTIFSAINSHIKVKNNAIIA